MKKYLKHLPKELAGFVATAARLSRDCGYKAYLVGGLVRDLILGARNFDLDIVVEGDGIKLARLLSEHLGGKSIRHHRFGTATVILSTDFKIDVASARKEQYPEPAALPIVSSASIKEDLARRDFSVNAMAIDICCNCGELIDLFNGRDDLKNKKISVLHSLSFIDDPTRILRAVRFEQRYCFKISRKTLKYLKDAKRLKMLEKVSPQRLRDELILMLSEPHPKKAVMRLQKLYRIRFIHPGLEVTRAAFKIFDSIDSEIAWFKKNFQRRRKLDTWIIYFMGLVSNLNFVSVKSILKKLVLRQGEEKRILGYAKNNSKIAAGLSVKDIRPAKIFEILEPLSYEAIIMLRAQYANCNLLKYTSDFLNKYNGVRLSITGHDLQSLGILPGPEYREILAKVFKNKLNGLAKDKKQELKLARDFKK
jgi:tRNA nucleotidyltransferase (CCA-adding enzyme)